MDWTVQDIRFMEKETAATDALGFHQSLLLDLYQ